MITPKERKETSMNILFFLKPKGELAYLYDDSTLRQGIEKLEMRADTRAKLMGGNAMKWLGMEGK